MSIKRAFSNKDTTIWSENGSTGNTGASPIGEVFSVSGGKLGKVTSRKEYARILMNFNLSSLTAGIVSTKTLPDPRTNTSASAYLKVFNAKHGGEQATSFNIDVFPISRVWNEGVGLDLDRLSNSGWANALSAQSSLAWSSSGGDFITDSNSATQYFDSGEEDLIVNITPIFNAWLNGTTATNGVIIKLTETQEASSGSLSSTNYYTKKFYLRETNTRRAPYIELQWPGAITDNRSAIAFNNTGSVFFYNIVNGQLQDLASTSAFPGNITISGLSSANTSFSAITTNLTAERFSKGVYKCNIGTLPLTASVYTSFRDNWYISASPTANYTFSFTAINPASGFSNFQTGSYKLTLKNLREHYEKCSIARLRMHIRDTSMQLLSMTGTTTALNNFICTDGTFEIREKKTDLVEIAADNLSHDRDGNFFTIDTGNLYVGVQYKIVIKLTIRGETYYYDEPDHWSFEVE